MKKISANFLSFFLGIFFCSIIIGFVLLYYNPDFIKNIFSSSENSDNSDIEVNIGQDNEQNTQALEAYSVDGEIKNDICSIEELSSIDVLSQSQYEAFLIHSLQSNAGGNDILFFVRDVQECLQLNERGIISDGRIFDCKIKHTTQELINGQIPDENLLLDIINLVPDFQKVVDAFTTKKCDSLASINTSFVDYCKDRNTFLAFKTELFEKNLSQLCQ